MSSYKIHRLLLVPLRPTEYNKAHCFARSDNGGASIVSATRGNLFDSSQAVGRVFTVRSLERSAGLQTVLPRYCRSAVVLVYKYGIQTLLAGRISA